MEVVAVKIPRELMRILGVSRLEDLERRSLGLLAADAYLAGKLSLGKAAELAGMSYDAFWDFLRSQGHRIRIGPRTLAEARREYRLLKSVAGSA